MPFGSFNCRPGWAGLGRWDAHSPAGFWHVLRQWVPGVSTTQMHSTLSSSDPRTLQAPRPGRLALPLVLQGLASSGGSGPPSPHLPCPPCEARGPLRLSHPRLTEELGTPAQTTGTCWLGGNEGARGSGWLWAGLLCLAWARGSRCSVQPSEDARVRTLAQKGFGD